MTFGEHNINNEFTTAIFKIWQKRSEQATAQVARGVVDAGNRGSVTGGNHLDALTKVIEQTLLDAGLKEFEVKTKSALEIPGYYRATKKWDIVAIHNGVLVAAIELKSMVGSTGNNFNNRAEEVLGNATDFWRAAQADQLGKWRPWLGYIMVLGISEATQRTVKIASTEPFVIDQIFENTNYEKRYEILIERLIMERLYDAACFVTTTPPPVFTCNFPNPRLNFDVFRNALRARVEFVKSSM